MYVLRSRGGFFMVDAQFNWGWIREKVKSLFQQQLSGQPNRYAALLSEIQAAQKEWGYAHQYFNLVTDPDLIDLAIYHMGVAEKKYLFLLKKAKETGACVERYGFR
jgi:hypothetical protein